MPAAKRVLTEAAMAGPSIDEAGAPDASAARMAPPSAGPIHVHLTGYAPGCERLGINSPRRNATFWGRTLSQVLRATLTRCRLAPGAVQVEGEVNGDINLVAAVPPELVGLQSSKRGVPVPFAIVWSGTHADALCAALADLRSSGWTPALPASDPESHAR